MNIKLFTSTFILIIALFLSCSKEKCKPFYDYDEIEWYNYKRNLDSIPPDLENNEFLIEVFQGSTFTKIKDVSKLNYLSINDFNKSIVPNSKYQELNKLFCYNENKEVQGFSTACIPFYNDILVFKKERKIVGIAKICFKCQQSTFTESKTNTSAFGAFEEITKLQKILYSK